MAEVVSSTDDGQVQYDAGPQILQLWKLVYQTELRVNIYAVVLAIANEEPTSDRITIMS